MGDEKLRPTALFIWVLLQIFVGARYQSPYPVVYATENRYKVSGATLLPLSPSSFDKPNHSG
jgi:hypothetical protein